MKTSSKGGCDVDAHKDASREKNTRRRKLDEPKKRRCKICRCVLSASEKSKSMEVCFACDRDQ